MADTIIKFLNVMKKMKLALASLVIAGMIGGGVVVAKQQVNAAQTLDASTEEGATTPNLSLERKGFDWDCLHIPAAPPCYYTWSSVTNSYSVPSSERGPIVN